MASLKDRDDEAKVRFLRKAVAGTDLDLNLQERTPLELSFQRIKNALYTLLPKLRIYHAQAKTENINASGAFCESFGKEGQNKRTAQTIMSMTLFYLVH